MLFRGMLRNCCGIFPADSDGKVLNQEKLSFSAIFQSVGNLGSPLDRAGNTL